MPEVFGPAYAPLYDALYAAKNYAAECRLIQGVFEQYSASPVHTVLDLGCGTGRHACELSDCGYSVTGVDRSPAMLREAAQKKSDNRVRLIESNLQALDLQERFDAALMMFAVLGYQLTDSDVDAAFQTAHRHLKPGGLLLFDCWYGPAVLVRKPSARAITVNTASGPVTRKSTSALDEGRRVCDVQFRIDPDISERHTVRYFFADELRGFLERAGFDLLRLGAFPDFARDPAPDTWNVMAVARS